MKKINGKKQKLGEQTNVNDESEFAAHIRDLEDEIETEELHGGSKFDWRSTKVGEVGSDSWNANMQEIELELELQQAQSVKSAVTKDIQRITQLAGIAKPKVEALAIKQVKRQTKKL